MVVSSKQRSSLDVLSAGTFTVHVPDIASLESNDGFGDLLKSNSAEDHEKLIALNDRSLVFYDEAVPIYVKLVLIATELSPVAFNAYLSRLVITVDIAAVNSTSTRYSSLSQQSHNATTAPKDTNSQSFSISSNVIDRSSIVCIREPTESELNSFNATNAWIAIWKLDAVIGHPRARLINPKICFSAQANLRAKNELSSVWVDDFTGEQATTEYLEPLYPANGINLLEGLEHDINFYSKPPVMSASKVLPPNPLALSSTTSSAQTTLSPSVNPNYIRLPRLNHKIFISVFPCINLRLKCSRLPSTATAETLSDFVVFANLDVDITHFAGVDVFVKSIELSLVGGKASRIGSGEHKAAELGDPPFLPMRCRPRDCISEIFRLYPLAMSADASWSRQSSNSSKVGILSSNITRTAIVKVVSIPMIRKHAIEIESGPQVMTTWQTTVDFSPNSTSQDIPRNSMTIQKPSVVPTMTSRSISGRSSTAWMQMHQQQQQRSPSGSSNDLQNMQVSQAAAVREIVHQGLSLTFSGPTEVKAGEVFSWKVFISNQSRTAKRISLLVQPKKWKVNSTKLLPMSPLTETARGIWDELTIYTNHQANMIESDELVSLVNDIRIGPLGPGASHETELKLVALGVGVLSLDGVRVVDLVKGEGFECTNLMNVICRRE
ncbi:TRAPP trafficking subunit Trs65-domain-containing protein [Dipodascopsis uninucleata]